MVAVTTLTSIGFMIIGVKYAIVLGIITGLLNLIPYIGILFAGLLSIIATLTGSPDLSLIIGVIVVIVYAVKIANIVYSCIVVYIIPSYVVVSIIVGINAI